MKKLLITFIILIPFFGLSQIPSYYNDVDLNLTDLALKDELATKVIATHTNFLVYTPGVWDALKQADLDPNDNTKVLLIYGYDDNDGVAKTDRTRSVDMNGGSVGDWNREHVYAKSLGIPNLGTSGPGSDAHHLRSCDLQWNSTRNNRKFASGTGNASITGAFWYPGDEWKGDVARMMMYMYLRYGNQCLPINVGEGIPVSIDANMIDLFLQWNVDDPVSVFESNRNSVLETIQGNRNPFIDNPVFATQIWGGPQAEDIFGTTSPDTEAPTVPGSLVVSNIISNSLILNWTAATDNILVSGYDVYQDGVYVDSTSNLSYEVIGLLPETSYSYEVYAKDSAGNISIASNTAIAVTTAGSGVVITELFLSEYIEGSSYNKAIEIANFTGQGVDLSNYSLKRNTNGGTSWGTALSLAGTIANGDVYVISHSSATSEVLNVADLLTSASAMTFNGNDPVGLFKNDVLIDVIGVFNNGTANFAANVTLQRKSSVIEPTIAYNVNEWDVLGENTFTGLGSHVIDGSGVIVDTEAPSIVTNVMVSNEMETTLDVTWDASTDNIAVTEYDVYVDGVFNVNTTNISAQINGLMINTSYSLTLYAKDAAGNVSNVSTAVIGSTIDLTPPTVPINAIAANITDTGVDLSWDVSSDNVAVTGYNVYESGVYITTVTGVNYQLTGLVPDTMYSFTINAVDASNNESGSSNSVDVLTTGAQTGGTVVLHEGFFESGWDGWSDGGGDCYRYSGSRSFEGSYSIRLRDNSGDKSAMTSGIFDLSSFDSVEMKFNFYSYGMENNENFFVQYFDGNTWVTLQNYVSGTDFDNNNFYMSTINLDSNTYSLVSNAQFKIQCDASSNSDHIYIDQVSIIGSNTVNLNVRDSYAHYGNTVNHLYYSDTSFESNDLNEIMIYPNPVSGSVLNVKIDNDFTNYVITNLIGQVVQKGTLRSEQLNIESLQPAMYILQINDGENVTSKKFIKQ